MRFFAIPAALLFAAVVRASNVIDLTPDNFDQYVGTEKGALVEFFAPWCGHCKTLAPTYEQLADAFPSGKVVIAKTDADGVGRPLGEKYGVQGFPTIKWFPPGSLEPEDYESGRDLESLVGFVTAKSGVKSNIKPPPPPAFTQLDVANFDEVVDGSKNVLVAFTAPWCSHCKSMKPTYEKVARAFEREADVVVAQVNADAEENRALASRYGVRSFPTIKFFPKGASPAEPIPYESGRSEAEFTDFINKWSGTHRTAAGILDDVAGRIAELDALAYRYVQELPSRDEVVAKARAFVRKAGEDAEASADYYVRVMERIATKGEEWLTKEINRLSNIVAGSNLAPAKLDEVQKKVNVLHAFTATEAPEVLDAEASEKVVKDEL